MYFLELKQNVCLTYCQNSANNLNLKFILLPKYLKKFKILVYILGLKKYKSLGKFTAKKKRLWDIIFY